jgi:glycine cleavage system H protein
MEGAPRARLTSLAAPPILNRETTLESAVSKVPDDLLYTAEHEYIARTKDPVIVRVGITDYAQGELGDVVFIRLPKQGDRVTAHQPFGEIEAVKAVSELYSPVTGEVVEINNSLDGDSGVVNRDPYGGGWMVTLRVSNPAELKDLMSSKAYRSHIGE